MILLRLFILGHHKEVVLAIGHDCTVQNLPQGHYFSLETSFVIENLDKAVKTHRNKTEARKEISQAQYLGNFSLMTVVENLQDFKIRVLKIISCLLQDHQVEMLFVVWFIGNG